MVSSMLTRNSSNTPKSDEALQQVANVAHLPGIVKHSLAMPDLHWGYGFVIGGVAATGSEGRWRGLTRRYRVRHQLRGTSHPDEP